MPTLWSVVAALSCLHLLVSIPHELSTTMQRMREIKFMVLAKTLEDLRHVCHELNAEDENEFPSNDIRNALQDELGRPVKCQTRIRWRSHNTWQNLCRASFTDQHFKLERHYQIRSICYIKLFRFKSTIGTLIVPIFF